jgi:hypothetical protein
MTASRECRLARSTTRAADNDVAAEAGALSTQRRDQPPRMQEQIESDLN